jgi:hypothetical protein
MYFEGGKSMAERMHIKEFQALHSLSAEVVAGLKSYTGKNQMLRAEWEQALVDYKNRDRLTVEDTTKELLEVGNLDIVSTYDSKGNLIKVEEKQNGVVAKTTTLTYDGTGILTGVTESVAKGSISYDLSDVSNIKVTTEKD